MDHQAIIDVSSFTLGAHPINKYEYSLLNNTVIESSKSMRFLLNKD